jgi:hypothetical protein
MRILALLIVAALPLRADSGTLTIHMILHAIGEERYQIAGDHGELALKTVFEYSDRGNKRTTTATLRTKSDFTPIDLEVKDQPTSVHVEGLSATVKERDAVRKFAAPANYFAIFGPTPFAVQTIMLRYWKAHGQPRSLPMLRAKSGADPIEIESVGHDDIGIAGNQIRLDRYTVENLSMVRAPSITPARVPCSV